MVIDDLQTILNRLERRLTAEIATAQTVYGPEAASDPHRGLYLSETEVERSLDRQQRHPWLAIERPLPAQAEFSARLLLLQRQFDLSEFDLDLILIALAPEIDRRYERIYAYLQDDVTRKYPSVDLVFNLGSLWIPGR